MDALVEGESVVTSVYFKVSGFIYLVRVWYEAECGAGGGEAVGS